MQSIKDGLKHYNYQCNTVSFMKNFIKKGHGPHKLYLAGLEEEKRIEAERKKQEKEDKEKIKTKEKSTTHLGNDYIRDRTREEYMRGDYNINSEPGFDEVYTLSQRFERDKAPSSYGGHDMEWGLHSHVSSSSEIPPQSKEGSTSGVESQSDDQPAPAQPSDDPSYDGQLRLKLKGPSVDKVVRIWTIGTWYVRGVCGKENEHLAKMIGRKIDILYLCETKRKGKDVLLMSDGILALWSGVDEWQLKVSALVNWLTHARLKVHLRKKKLKMCVYLMSRVVLRMDLDDGVNTTVQDLVQTILQEEDLGLPRAAANIFTLWISSGLLELQLKPHHKPYEIRRSWSKLLTLYGNGTESRMEKDEPILSYQRNVFFSKRDEEKINSVLYVTTSVLYVTTSVLYITTSVLYVTTSVLYVTSSVLYVTSSVLYVTTSVLDLKLLELLYEEARHNILEGRYPCEVSHYIMLGGIQASIELGPYNPHVHTTQFFREQQHKFLPAHVSHSNWSWLRISSKNSPEVRLLEQFKRIPSSTPVRKLVRKYLEFCWSLPYYGGAFFQGQIEQPVRGLTSLITHQDVPVLVAINAHGVYIIDDIQCAVMMDTLITVFVEDLKQKTTTYTDETERPVYDTSTDSDDTHVPLTMVNRRELPQACLSNKLSKLTLATFDEDGKLSFS
uniref:FERM domain-containing protein 8 n=1 Tax=Timema bartmani TaxID=61472 RepID=A0A7R9EY32_9NEOP|nr:unnamed protein product [Timema bartmani]